MPQPPDQLTDAAEFHSSLRIYLNAVEMLAASPNEQCELMGDYNVAWELKEDVQAGRYLLGRGYLEAEEEAWVSALACALDSINTQVLPAGAGREVNLVAMSNPCWVPVRSLAAECSQRLSAAETTNAKYLGLNKNAA
jgi:hypothetical protein